MTKIIRIEITKDLTMNRFHRLAWPLAASCALAAPAMAQDRDSHFDGPYIGVAGGATLQNSSPESLVFDRNADGTFGDTVTTATGANAFSPGFCDGFAQGTAPGNCENDRNRGDYAIRIGVDKRLGSAFVGGVLVEASKNDARDATSAFSTTPASYTIARGLDYGFAARARAGITPGGGALFYGTGGVTYSKLKHDFTTSNTANTFAERNDGDFVWGWQAGGGAEIMVLDNVSLGIEYLYSRYNDDKYYVAVAQGTAPATNPFVLGGGGTTIRQSNDKFNVQSLRASVNFQF